jgi:lambda family phage minor tail protein L
MSETFDAISGQPISGDDEGGELGGYGLNQEKLKPATSAYIELFELDTTNIGGMDIFYFTPITDGNGGFVEFDGNVYIPIPVSFEGSQYTATSQAPSKPTLTVSNVSHYLINVIASLGDLCGAKVTRKRTFARYLDGQPDQDGSAYFPPDVMIIDQKVSHDKHNIRFSLTITMDRPDLMLPLRQVLKNNYPGVSSVLSAL